MKTDYKIVYTKRNEGSQVTEGKMRIYEGKYIEENEEGKLETVYKRTRIIKEVMFKHSVGNHKTLLKKLNKEISYTDLTPINAQNI